MHIELSPELQAQIQQNIERGPFRSVDEYVECALALLHEQETWLSENRELIAAQVQAGWESAERGELADENTVREHMRRRKADWQKQKHSA